VEAMAGFTEANREPGQAPRVGTTGAVGDIGAGLFACIGTLAALRHRDQTGQGQHVDVALYDAMLAMADSIPFMWSLVRDEHSGPRSATSIVGGFAASDGYFVMLVRDFQFETLASVVGHPEWMKSPALSAPTSWRDQLDSLIRPAVEKWASNRTKVEAAHELCARGIAAGPSNGPADIATDPHVWSHDMLIKFPRPDAESPLLIVGNPIKFSSEPKGSELSRWPLLGQHTFEVLETELNLSKEQLDKLAERGVIA
jgi:formyl-CoA transferase